MLTAFLASGRWSASAYCCLSDFGAQMRRKWRLSWLFAIQSAAHRQLLRWHNSGMIIWPTFPAASLIASLCFILLIINFVLLSTARWDGSPCGISGFSKFIGQTSAQLLYCSGGKLPKVVYLPMHEALQSLLSEAVLGLSVLRSSYWRSKRAISV